MPKNWKLLSVVTCMRKCTLIASNFDIDNCMVDIYHS